MQDFLADWQLEGCLSPWTCVSSYCRAVPRDQNKDADSLANAALDLGAGSTVWFDCRGDFSDLSVFTDGASRGNPGPSSCAAVISGLVGTQWRRLVQANRLLGEVTNNIAELEGMILACELLQSLLTRIVLVE